MLQENVMLFDDYPCLFSGVAPRLASCGRWMKRGSLSTWWAAPPLALSWERCTLRRRATVAWGSGLASGQWCVEHYTEERKAHVNKTLGLLFWHLFSYLSASQMFSLHNISEFLLSLPIIIIPVTSFFSQDMTSYFKKILDLTYPVTSMFSGASFNSGISSVFKDKQIEVRLQVWKKSSKKTKNKSIIEIHVPLMKINFISHLRWAKVLCTYYMFCENDSK